MGWSRDESLSRIRRLREKVPEQRVNVKNWGAADIAVRQRNIKAMRDRGGDDEPVIFNVGPNEAIVVDGVHVYAQLIDFHDAMMQNGRETEGSHSRALAMQHLHYTACDRIAEAYEAQRVDFHGGRLHAVIVSPGGPEGARGRARRAMAFAHALKATIERAGGVISGGRYATRVRIGLDAGLAVAVNSGRGSEPEPLFLGRPANYAAKLADGDQPGIFISDAMRRDLALIRTGADIIYERSMDMAGETSRLYLDEARTIEGQNPVFAIDRIVANLQTAPELAYFAAPVSFEFHRHEPPLRTIDFRLLMPSNTVRMPLASIFADIDGFTRYVDECIETGRIAELVANLYVIRSEQAATLKYDSGGRKVRFIGDCLHGLIAVGSRAVTDEPATVLAAVETAGSMRSSFELCQEVLPNAGNLGLAIGIELGPTPITRLGLRGDRSVRCASSSAVSWSEKCQSGCGGQETALGPVALARAPASVRRLFDKYGRAHGLDNASVSQLLAAPAIISSGSVSRPAKPYAR